MSTHEALPLGELHAHAGCTNCDACFRVCPTGAIRIEEDEERWKLVFSFDRCVACGVCLEVCQPNVLYAAERFDAVPERPRAVLHQLAKQRCRRCDRWFVAGEAREFLRGMVEPMRGNGEMLGAILQRLIMDQVAAGLPLPEALAEVHRLQRRMVATTPLQAD